MQQGEPYSYNDIIALEAKAGFILSLRRRGITDHKTLQALESVPRLFFLPEDQRHRTGYDESIPIECGQFCTKPSMIAALLQVLCVDSHHVVLEIGTGSGYQTTLLAHMAKRVMTLEICRPLVERARRRFDSLKMRNVHSLCADGVKGWAQSAPYDRIIVNASAQTISQFLLDQLAPDGILLMPIDHGEGIQNIMRLKQNKRERDVESLMQSHFQPLISRF